MARKRIEIPKNKRLVLAYKYAKYDVMEKDFSRTVAMKMIKDDIVPFKVEYDYKKELESKIGSVSRSLNKHLSYDDCLSISGEWILRYCKFLGCSADFLYEQIDTPLHEHADIGKWTGLSVKSINQLHRIHTHKWRNNSTEYTEPHKTIDFLNVVLQDPKNTLLYDCYEYIHAGDIVLPKTVDLYDDSGTGHTLPAAKIYKQIKLTDIIDNLNNLK